ncbi:hypothetical protein Natpe_1955 [Natrinema pellirubrum DSM 15624]|uniref:Uncharacterized protein n=1 Tax=Natrinema pellirubrum (strain DSM 15624 / CIP 106293 / JCM 10476 / NCIMB 786 / 157) TaxID=797303 RepID=L0JJW8_NATP1|nr:hypothetical protein Natpe_1955 [Natrinema pellirubrum DSM 15624]
MALLNVNSKVFQQSPQFRIGCDGDSPKQTIRFGPEVADGLATTSPLVFVSTGQVQLEFPTFMARAWRLVDCAAAWDEGSVTIDEETGSRTVTAPIEEWESPVDLDLFSLAKSEPYRSTIQRAGDERQNTISMLPMEGVRKIGIERGGSTLVEPSFACVDGQAVVVLSWVDKLSPTSQSIVFAGPSNSQPRIAAGEITVGLGVSELLERGESIPMRWVVQGEELVGFVADEIDVGA